MLASAVYFSLPLRCYGWYAAAIRATHAAAVISPLFRAYTMFAMPALRVWFSPAFDDAASDATALRYAATPDAAADYAPPMPRRHA